jgi:hypothetical protein
MWLRIIDELVDNTPGAVRNVEMVAQLRRAFFGGAASAFALVKTGYNENVERDIEAFFKGEE